MGGGENKHICNLWNIIENIVRKPQKKKIHAPSPTMAASTLIILFPKKSENFYKNLKETKLYVKENF